MSPSPHDASTDLQRAAALLDLAIAAPTAALVARVYGRHAAARRERPAPIDVYRALDYTLPCLAAAESAAAGGAPVPVPDPREW